MDLLRPLWIRAAQKVSDWMSPQGTVKNYFVYYQPTPYIHRETTTLHHYTIPALISAAEFARVGGEDFRGDAAALDSALRDFFWTARAIQEREIVLLTPSWAAHYTVTEHTAPTVLTIQITPQGSQLA